MTRPTFLRRPIGHPLQQHCDLLLYAGDITGLDELRNQGQVRFLRITNMLAHMNDVRLLKQVVHDNDPVMVRLTLDSAKHDVLSRLHKCIRGVSSLVLYVEYGREENFYNIIAVSTGVYD
jgi:hypothetical protein